MWLPDPGTAIQFGAALLSAVAAALSIVERARSIARREPPGRDDDDNPGDDNGVLPSPRI
ncbi:hypothetical protein [Actinoplanes sp. NPDC051494]|uniref:hypothetical protein n=1 Tax=Actinoplanes sp. NPDC051494 TaxID=3363907 RepID=UPI00379420CA